MSPEVQAIERMHEELGGDNNPNLTADITQFLIRAQRELTPEENERFRKSLREVQAHESIISVVALSFGKLFGSRTGLKVDFNRFVGTCWKLKFTSDIQKREAAALGAYNEGEEPEEQSAPETVPSGSAEMHTDLSSISGNESEAAPTTSAGIVPDQSAE